MLLQALRINALSAPSPLMSLMPVVHEFRHISIAKYIIATAIIARKMLVHGHCSSIDRKRIKKSVAATPINVAVALTRLPDVNRIRTYGRIRI